VTIKWAAVFFPFFLSLGWVGGGAVGREAARVFVHRTKESASRTNSHPPFQDGILWNPINHKLTKAPKKGKNKEQNARTHIPKEDK